MPVAVRRVLLPLLGFALFVLAWWAIAEASLTNAPTPTPGEVGRRIVEGVTEGDLLTDIRLSALRVLIGVAIGCALALPIGFLLAWFGVFRQMFDPLVNFFRALPPIALIPLVIVYVGVGEQARLTVLVYAAFFSAVVVMFETVAAIDDIYIRAGRAMGATQFELFRKVVVPYSVPQMFVAIRVALGICWATLVAAELVAAQRGLGAFIQKAGNFFRLTDIYAGIVLIGLCALVMDLLLRQLMAVAVRWQERVER